MLNDTNCLLTSNVLEESSYVTEQNKINPFKVNTSHKNRTFLEVKLNLGLIVTVEVMLIYNYVIYSIQNKKILITDCGNLYRSLLFALLFKRDSCIFYTVTALLNLGLNKYFIKSFPSPVSHLFQPPP